MEMIEKYLEQIDLKQLEGYDTPFAKIMVKLNKTEQLIYYFILVLDLIKRSKYKKLVSVLEQYTNIYEADRLYSKYLDTNNPLYKLQAEKIIEPNYAFIKKTIYHFREKFKDEGNFNDMFNGGKF